MVGIARRIAERGDGVLITRAAEDAVTRCVRRFRGIELNAEARTAFLRRMPRRGGPIARCSSSPRERATFLAEEAAVTADAMGWA